VSELQQYYDACQSGAFACEDEAECPCRGGWFLSQVDTLHKCPLHYKGQPNPEFAAECEA
jgi:hypothetical protein